MYEMAKKAREKMKAKARSLAAPGTLESGQKTTSADWTPAEALNADAKTGMRPISQRAYKGGGKVSGATAKPRADRKARKSGGRVETEIGVGMANKNMKDANKDRPGVKHVGGFKHGGEVKDAGVKDKKALGAIDPSPKRGPAGHYKKGGKVKKADGGGSFLQKMVGGGEREKREREIRDVGKGQTSNYSQEERGALNKAIRANDALPASANYKKGGRTKRDFGGKVKEALDKVTGYKSESQRQQENMPDPSTRKGVDYGDPAMKGDRDRLDRMSSPYKKGGRTARATGGLINALKGGKKAKGKGAKTDINIVINAGHRTPMKHPAAGPMPPIGGDGMPPMPPAGAGAPPPAIPASAPMPMPPGAGPALPPGLPGRKAGGRITKTASSYKDMEAGAASGEGRLQKTEIAKKHKDAPARKEGGRITKVAKSYKDMEAGAASGEGRLQKTDIAKAKK